MQLAPGNSKGLLLANPVMTASGTFGYGTEYSHLFNINRLGAMVCKGTTLEPREGNPQPRIAETACGALNAIGMQNIGIDALIADKAPLWAGWRVPVIVNIAGDSMEHYAQAAGRLEGVAGISAIEVNIGCPNIKDGGIHFGSDPKSAAAVTGAVRQATTLPLLVKLTPHTADIAAVAAAVADAGADAITAINTLQGMAIDTARRQPLLGNISGGLSGPAMKPVALHMVYQVAGAVSIPIVGCGGIASARDALEFIMAGASAIQIGTAGFKNPHAPLDILEGIEEFMRGEGIKDLNQLVGAARP